MKLEPQSFRQAKETIADSFQKEAKEKAVQSSEKGGWGWAKKKKKLSDLSIEEAEELRLRMQIPPDGSVKRVKLQIYHVAGASLLNKDWA